MIKVQECSPQVLATTLDFIYGISLPEDLSTADAQSLLIMADLYLMEDLKVALAPLLGKRLNEGNVLEISVMAERHSAQDLLDVCSDFILNNKTDLIGELFAALPSMAVSCFDQQQNIINFANRVLGVNLATKFKKRVDFKSDLEYKDYMMQTMKSGMLVICNQTSEWTPASSYYRRSCPEHQWNYFYPPLIEFSSIGWKQCNELNWSKCNLLCGRCLNFI